MFDPPRCFHTHYQCFICKHVCWVCSDFLLAIAPTQLIDELDACFRQQSVFWVLYPPPPYRMQEGCEESFHKHLNILRVFYYEVKWAKARDGTKHFNPLLDHWELNLQQWMLKMAMKRSHKATLLPPFDVSPLTQLWMTMNGRCLLK